MILETLLDECSAQKESPEVLYEVMRALAAEVRPISISNAASIERSASTMIPMFGRHGAERDWAQERREMKWWDRIRNPREPDEDYRRLWTESERDRGRQLVKDFLDG